MTAPGYADFTLRFTTYGDTMDEVIRRVDERLDLFAPGSEWEAQIDVVQEEAVWTSAGVLISWTYQANVVARYLKRVS